MAKFRVGDQVERIGSLGPLYMRRGVIVQVIPNQSGMEWLTEYEIDFGNNDIATFYETQLRLIQEEPD
jgi:hypothetical protein